MIYVSFSNFYLASAAPSNGEFILNGVEGLWNCILVASNLRLASMAS